MKKKYYSPIVLSALAIVGLASLFAYTTRSQDTNMAQQTSPIPTQAISPSPHQTSPEPTATFHPVSLPALAQKPLSGSNFTIGRVLESNTTYTRHYITYNSGDLKISGIMNRPKGDGPFPILILNHGYIDPAIYTNGRGLKREQDYFAKEGFVVVHPDYRNHADSDSDPDNDLTFRLGYIEDAANLVDALKKSGLPYLDTTRIGMLGHSMGGGVTLGVLVTHPDLVQAATLYAPVSASAKENFDRYTSERPELAALITNTYGTPETNPEFWKNVSFETFLGNIKVPLIVHHGTADDSTPYRWSEDVVNNLKRLNKDVMFYTYPGEPHEFTSAWPTAMQRSTEFFKTNL